MTARQRLADERNYFRSCLAALDTLQVGECFLKGTRHSRKIQHAREFRASVGLFGDNRNTQLLEDLPLRLVEARPEVFRVDVCRALLRTHLPQTHQFPPYHGTPVVRKVLKLPKRSANRLLSFWREFLKLLILLTKLVPNLRRESVVVFKPAFHSFPTLGREF